MRALQKRQKERQLFDRESVKVHVAKGAYIQKAKGQSASMPDVREAADGKLLQVPAVQQPHQEHLIERPIKSVKGD